MTKNVCFNFCFLVELHVFYNSFLCADGSCLALCLQFVLCNAMCCMHSPAAGTKLWSNVMEILDEKDGVDTELLVYAMTLINKVSKGKPHRAYD